MRLAVVALLLLAAGAARADVKVLSAGAVEPGLRAAAEAFRAEGGEKVAIAFATAPAVRQRVAGGEAADIVIAPPPVLAELETAGRLAAGSRVELGRVGIGAVVRDGAALPDLSTPDALKRALLAADSIVFNRASTGLYIERLLERLGVADAVRPRTTRYPDGAAVMEHVVEGRGREIGFGAMTEIALYRGKGLQLAGPLPAELQNYTSYAAAAAAPPTDVATRFLRFLAGAEAKALFAANGIE